MSLNCGDEMFDVVPLSLLPVGQVAHVEHVSGEPNAVHRLKELGFCDGVQVEMVQSGSSCIVRLAGHKLGFRADDAVNVWVRQTTLEGTAE